MIKSGLGIKISWFIEFHHLTTFRHVAGNAVYSSPNFVLRTGVII